MTRLICAVMSENIISIKKRCCKRSCTAGTSLEEYSGLLVPGLGELNPLH